jgi:hypothetical protein
MDGFGVRRRDAKADIALGIDLGILLARLEQSFLE